MEYSKILPNAAFASAGKDRDGDMYRASDVRSAPPTILSMNSYTGVLSQITPAPSTFLNNVNTTSGSIFKLWENYGQIKNTPDSIVFYNDSIKVQSSIQTVATLISQSNFTFSIGRPNPAALIDSIAIRTGTVIYENAAGTKLTVPFTASDKKDLFIKLPNNYTTPTATTVPPIGSMTGPIAAAGVTLNSTSNLDEISVTFTAPPFANKTATAHAGVQDPAGFYKVYATIFYKYKVNDSITLVDNSISTRPQTYELVLTKPLRWSYINPNGPKPIAAPTNQPVKMATRLSARLAIGYSGGGTAGQTAIIVSKSPLNLNDPLSFVRVSGTGALTQDANGASTTSVISITAKPSVIEWSKSGTELYFATEDNKLYRVSNLYTIMDNTPSNYSGKLSTDIFRYNSASPTNPFNSTVINPNSPYRTTLLGSFTTKTITSISISKNDSSMALTFNDPAGTIVMYSGNNIRTSDHTNINFTSRNGTGLSNVTAYCSLMEKDNSKEVFIGTNKGIYYTSDITATTPSWSNINNQLPTIQVFDLEQQTLPPWSCYNSGQIYAATYGRGVWTNKNYFSPTIVSVKEQEKPKVENNLSVYPNPTNGSVFVSFNSVNGESVNIQIMDINGRVVKSEPIGKLYPGQLTYSMETSDLSAGIYMVNVISDSNVKRVAKLVVTK